MASEEAWVGIAEVAAHLSVARDSIYRWVETKDFPAHRVGRLLRFRISEVDEWVMTSRGNYSRPLSEPNNSSETKTRLDSLAKSLCRSN